MIQDSEWQWEQPGDKMFDFTCSWCCLLHLEVLFFIFLRIQTWKLICMGKCGSIHFISTFLKIFQKCFGREKWDVVWLLLWELGLVILHANYNPRMSFLRLKDNMNQIHLWCSFFLMTWTSECQSGNLWTWILPDWSFYLLNFILKRMCFDTTC